MSELKVVENPVTPMRMLQIAVEQNADMDKLQKLMDLQERWEKSEAKKAFVKAITAFNKNQPEITKDKKNKQYNSMYASLPNLVNTAAPRLSEHDLSASWKVTQDGGVITVIGILTHVLGHSESVSISGPPDTSGAKNKLQEIKSTITYLKGETFSCVTGLAASEESDDDGNSGGALVSDKQVAELTALITEVKADKAKFLAYMKADALEKIPAAQYSKAVKALEDKRKSA